MNRPLGEAPLTALERLAITSPLLIQPYGQLVFPVSHAANNTPITVMGSRSVATLNNRRASDAGTIFTGLQSEVAEGNSGGDS